MDTDISRWILEFLLRRSVDDRTVDVLTGILPIPNNSSNFKKTVLLRKILSQIATNSVSEKILSLLEQIEELDHIQGDNSPQAIKAAYCAVAVHCTLRFVDDKSKYFDAVKRIWKLRVCKMEGGLVSEELRSWRDEIEAAVWDQSVCQNLVLRSKGYDAVGLVRVYVDQEMAKMGPSFIELLAETFTENLGLLNNGMSECDPVAPSLSSGGPDVVVSTSNKDMPKGNVLPRRKHVANRYFRKAICGTSRGAKIADTEQFVDGTSCNEDLRIPEIDKVQEALESSLLELRDVVKDPLPDAVHLSDTIISSMAQENGDHDPAVANQNRVDVDAPSSSVDRNADAVRANEGNLGSRVCSHQKNGTKPSLMERNSTACSFEWDDSIDGLPEGSLKGVSRLHLPTPKKRAVSPLKKYEIAKLSRRRKFKKWSTLEEDSLRAGVQKYGVGNWKLILNIHRDIFEERTEVDLKDKWRNMIRDD